MAFPLCVCAQLHNCVQLCNIMDCSSWRSSILGISQARILEWVAMSNSRGSSWTRDQICVSSVSCIGRWILYHCTTLETWEVFPFTLRVNENTSPLPLTSVPSALASSSSMAAPLLTLLVGYGHMMPVSTPDLSYACCNLSTTHCIPSILCLSL